MNHLAATTTNEKAIGQVFNTACGDQSTLIELVHLLKSLLSDFDHEIKNIAVTHGPERSGDIPHSLASIEKAKSLLDYVPSHDLKTGLEEAINWYWNELK